MYSKNYFYDSELATIELKMIPLLSSTPEIVVKLLSSCKCLLDSRDTSMFQIIKDNNIITNYRLIQDGVICIPQCPQAKFF